ncbi:MAG: hypothetical protein AAF532_02385 [Planctomycetota bacterium]
MTWFVEDWLTPLLACGTLAAVAFVLPGIDRAAVRAAVVGLLLAVGLAAPLVDAAVVTPRERLVDSLYALADHVVDGDGPGAVGLMSPANAMLRDYAGRVAERVDVDEDLRVFDVDATLLPGGKVGTTHFRANGTVRIRGGGFADFSRHTATRWILKWQHEEDDVWRVREVTMLDPVSGDEIDTWRRL